MEKQDFEAAILAAVAATPNNGSKWSQFESLFLENGLVGAGAISNQPAEQGTRVTQLFASRNTPMGRVVASYCVFVLNEDQAARHLNNPEATWNAVRSSIASERQGYIPPKIAIESVLVLRVDPVAGGGRALVPLGCLFWGMSPQTRLYFDWYPGLEPYDLSGTLMEGVRSLSPPTAAVTSPGVNIIYFGPPGTGKSHAVQESTASFGQVLHTAFHPEYGYADFVGTYKAVCGSDTDAEILSYDGATRIPKPVVYYEFDPGVCVQAIVAAAKTPGGTVALVIDEISRGDCAAIFGDFLHLLDRAADGSSSYGINVSVPLAKFLIAAGVLNTAADKLRLPANLHLLGTMNTSDQAIFPMDSAFKRRWSWRAVPSTGAGREELADVLLEGQPPDRPVKWLDFVDWLNEYILRVTENEDKRIGPWYIKPDNALILSSEIRDKLLYFLWFDVFKGRSEEVFAVGLRTFDGVQKAFDEKGLGGVLLKFRGTFGAAASSAAPPLAKGEAATQPDA